MLARWSSTQKVVSLSSAESEYHSMVRCASEAIDRIGQHDTGAWTRSTRIGSRKWERRNQAFGNEVLLAAPEREKPGAQDREDPRHSQSRRVHDETSGWETFGDVRIDGRPSSAPKLTIDIECISRASRKSL